jgi:hypothetical protein
LGLYFDTAYLDGGINLKVDTIRPVFDLGYVGGTISQNDSGVPERVTVFNNVRRSGGGFVKWNSVTEKITKTGDGASTSFGLIYSEPLAHGLEYWDANLNDERSLPYYDIDFATNDYISVTFASAPSHGTTLEFGIEAKVV